MSTYRDHPDAIRALVQDERVHRDAYLSDEVFELEQRHFVTRTWSFLGHTSQVPEAGDYVAVELAGGGELPLDVLGTDHALAGLEPARVAIVRLGVAHPADRREVRA